jgi:predicted permease
VDVGFEKDGILQADADFTPIGISPGNRTAFQREMLATVRALPGVDGAATVAGVPLLGNSWSNSVWMDDVGKSGTRAGFFNRVSDGYFTAFNIPLLGGRDFDDRDSTGSQKVAIVNEEFAAQFAGGRNPVGRRFWVETTPNEPETLYEIVGYVRNTKYQNLRETLRPLIFLADSQAPRRGTYAQIMIRTRLPLNTMMGAVKGALAELNPKIGFHYHVYREQILDGLIQERLLATLASLFGLLATALATLGLYGFISFVAARRTNEIGIRMALGAQRADILRMVVREAGLLLVVGLVLGCGLALAAGKTVRAMLFDIAPHDPLALGLSAAALAAVTLTAAWLPARRAAGLNPMAALRHD